MAKKPANQTTTKTTTKYDPKTGKPISSQSTSTSASNAAAKRKLTQADFGFSSLYKGFLRANPDIAKGLTRAIKEEWSLDQWNQFLSTSKWARARTTSQRQFDLEEVGNTKESQKKVSATVTALRERAAQMGVTVADKTLQAAARTFTRDGSDSNAIDIWLGNQVSITPPTGGNLKGDTATTVDRLRALAQKYGVKPTNNTLLDQTKTVLKQGVDPDSYEDYYRSQAVAAYPALAEELKTHSVADILGSYGQIAANTLGIDPDSIDFSEPKWSVAGDYTDPSTGKVRKMTKQEWAKTIRTDTTYDYDHSDNAIAIAKQGSRALASAFGASG